MRSIGTAAVVCAGVLAGSGGCVYDYAALGGRHVEGTGGADEPGTGGDMATGSGGAGADTSRGSGGAVNVMRGSGGASGSGGARASGGAMGAGGAVSTGGSASGGAVGTDPDLVLWYKFDEDAGLVAADSATAGGGPHDGALSTAGNGGAIAFSSLHQVGTHSLSLTANANTGGGYLTLPALVSLAPNAVTVAAWVFPTSNRDWQRVFDYGNNTTVNMFLTTSEGSDANNYVRFALTIAGGQMEQRIDTTTVLTLNAWHHVAVVLTEGATGVAYLGTLYIDGIAAGSNPALMLRPSDLGATTNNYLGKSQFPADAYLAGQLDDFRIYRRALSAADITALFSLR